MAPSNSARRRIAQVAAALATGMTFRAAVGLTGLVGMRWRLVPIAAVTALGLCTIADWTFTSWVAVGALFGVVVVGLGRFYSLSALMGLVAAAFLLRWEKRERVLVPLCFLLGVSSIFAMSWLASWPRRRTWTDGASIDVMTVTVAPAVTVGAVLFLVLAVTLAAYGLSRSARTRDQGPQRENRTT